MPRQPFLFLPHPIPSPSLRSQLLARSSRSGPQCRGGSTASSVVGGPTREAESSSKRYFLCALIKQIRGLAPYPLPTSRAPLPGSRIPIDPRMVAFALLVLRFPEARGDF